MLKTIRHAALIAGAALIATTAQAQVRDLDGEQSDVRVFQGRVAGEAAVFTLTLPADTGLQVDAIATGDLDPVLRVKDASGELLAENDDFGDELNSRVMIGASDRSRRLTIEVDSFDADWAEEGESYGGTFDLRLATSDYVDVGTRAVSYGARETGTLMGGEHLFTIRGKAGESVEVALIATDDSLDPYLELRDPAGESVASDDDGGGDLNSLLRHTFTQDGTYTIVATGFGESTGAYRLRVREQREVPAQLPLQVIGIDDEATGVLAGGWDEAGDATLTPSYIDYQLSEEAKATIRSGNGELSIRMSGGGESDPDFGDTIDPYIELGFDTPLGFAVVESDDDGAGDLDALLPVDLGLLAAEPGLLDKLRIRAQGYGGSDGEYTLVVTPGMAERVEQPWDDAEAAVEAAAEAIEDAAGD
ncbi:PPC domain-containing protein [Aurantiacibacter odishensis]|uniref:PPC domain-containing protein n=1 Tax=Aurantiacibacter odishensis TaxID=1155476 RepID=UPI000E76664A|nr:PPC domain-containing protein [Aurantiacibacter odishensis]